MGTVIEITLLGENEEATRKAALQAFHEIRRIEQAMSPRIESSDLTRINRSAGTEWVQVLPETVEVIESALKISELSMGAFDISVGPLVQLWSTATERKIPPSNEELQQKLASINFKDVLINPQRKVLLKKRGMAIHLGGIAKGYAVDRAFDLLRSLEYKNLIVNAGGDLKAGGLKEGHPWSIGIQDPRAPEKMMAKVSVSDSAMATSGDYERFFIHQGKRYHHILNPSDGLPAEGCQSVTVLCKEGAIADALATAIFILGPEKGYLLCQKLEGVDCLIVNREREIIYSPGLKEHLSGLP